MYRYFFVRRQLDVEAMREGAARLVGKHDFRNFCTFYVVSISGNVASGVGSVLWWCLGECMSCCRVVCGSNPSY